MEYLPLIVAAAITAVVGGFIVAKGGLRGAIFGSKIRRTVGELHPQSRAMMNYPVRVHVLESGDIGLELSTSAGLTFAVHGCVLTSEQARQLAGFLDPGRHNGNS